MTVRARPDVAVIIPALNVAATIAEQLRALAAQEYAGEWQVLVADNGCTDGTESIVRAFAPDLSVRWIDATGRRGINHARNRGAQETDADILLFCDGDDVVADGWIEAMVEAIDGHDAVGGAIATSVGGTIVSAARLPRNLIAPEWLPSPIGANCGIQREAWERLGGFDESLDRGACDETDLFWRVQTDGGSVATAPGAVIEYAVRDSARDRAKKSYRSTREMARLHRRFKFDGHPRRSSASVAKNWAWVILNLPRAAISPHFRDRYLPAAAQPLGRLAGSIRYRTVYL